ncbi:alpha/beta fold hydrolase [Blattabacterium cuenoti]|uniref:alpha/beta fold hydrolase n=1 Tax=Blattabacterium cuenoti TaxID=1653831 RepID=UPI00163BE8C7|nr:alpha/beta fold hydrolase [Blattabacterium cuenoti]
MVLYSKIIGKGFPILVFHGLFGNGDNWISFAKEFSSKYQIHLLDIRNHGNSFYSNKMDYDLISKDILVYLHHYKIDKPILIGHSMGGRAVMYFSMNYPSIPKKIIILDISPKSYPSTYYKNVIQVLKSVDFNCIQKRIELEEFLNPFIPDKETRSFFSKCTYRKKNGKLAFRFFLVGIENNYSCLINKELKNGIFNGPTLFLRGEYSNYLLIEDFFFIKKLFTKAKIILIKKAKHWIHIDNKIDFYKEVRNFLNQEI